MACAALPEAAKAGATLEPASHTFGPDALPPQLLPDPSPTSFREWLQENGKGDWTHMNRIRAVAVPLRGAQPLLPQLEEYLTQLAPGCGGDPAGNPFYHHWGSRQQTRGSPSVNRKLPGQGQRPSGTAGRRPAFLDGDQEGEEGVRDASRGGAEISLPATEALTRGSGVRKSKAGACAAAPPAVRGAAGARVGRGAGGRSSGCTAPAAHAPSARSASGTSAGPRRHVGPGEVTRARRRPAGPEGRGALSAPAPERGRQAPRARVPVSRRPGARRYRSLSRPAPPGEGGAASGRAVASARGGGRGPGGGLGGRSSLLLKDRAHGWLSVVAAARRPGTRRWRRDRAPGPGPCRRPLPSAPRRHRRPGDFCERGSRAGKDLAASPAPHRTALGPAGRPRPAAAPRPRGLRVGKLGRNFSPPPARLAGARPAGVSPSRSYLLARGPGSARRPRPALLEAPSLRPPSCWATTTEVSRPFLSPSCSSATIRQSIAQLQLLGDYEPPSSRLSLEADLAKGL
ncbi:PREDICTED: collagen alpha-1(I) chain-like [Elephantulus edwardii]|uniref:collagen alpha-1(I) chain-like n=1 Tax=Elephantulus edwardii TaxID=28737 RepID=UPI0003F0DFFF|nr:PREDICTED: collagen alpha-1(I) chain-like [Elephantulus edwardii]